MQTPEASPRSSSPTLISCAADSPVRHFLRLAGEKDLKMQEVLSSLSWPAWLKPSDRRIFSLKTSQGCCRMTAAGHLLPSSPRFMTWGIMSNGLCLTANISECRSQESGCSLSDILIPDAPEKYFLSSEQVQKLLYNPSENCKAPVSATRKA